MVSGKAGTREAPSVQSRKRLDLGSAVGVQGNFRKHSISCPISFI